MDDTALASVGTYLGSKKGEWDDLDKCAADVLKDPEDELHFLSQDLDQKEVVTGMDRDGGLGKVVISYDKASGKYRVRAANDESKAFDLDSWVWARAMQELYIRNEYRS